MIQAEDNMTEKTFVLAIMGLGFFWIAATGAAFPTFTTWFVHMVKVEAVVAASAVLAVAFGKKIWS